MLSKVGRIPLERNLFFDSIDPAQTFGAQSAFMPANFTTLAHFSVSEVSNRPKSAGAPRNDYTAEVGKPRLELEIREPRVDFPVELVHDLGRSVLRRTDAKRCARLITRYKIGDGWDIGQRRRARRRRHR